MFRASVRTYLSMLLNGATFYPVDLAHEDPADLASWMVQEEITIYRSAVSAFRSLTTGLTGGERFPHLRLILLYGEPVYHTDVAAYRESFPAECILASSLGCNEIDDFSYFFIDRNTSTHQGFLPAGYPVEDIDILLLDDNGSPVVTLDIGEICVRSRHSPAAYWRQPEVTRAAFISDPDGSEARVYRTGDLGRMAEDGCLIHMGRKDDQVKILGYRVDIGEVEAALLANGELEQAAVVGVDHRKGEKKLVAYIVPSGSNLPGPRELRRRLLEKLPSYAVPSMFILLDSMPMTATGKIDRRRLPQPDGTRPELREQFVEPRSPVEEQLARIWAEVLNVERVGAFDNFVDLGGDSLQAARVIGRVMKQFHVRLPLQTVVDSSNLAEMTVIIVDSQSESIDEPELDDLLGDLERLSETEARSRLEQNDL
jgi:acyl-coenzyme A synthetase/AMP-(fatty) acid ligase/acyl carrier protein